MELIFVIVFVYFLPGIIASVRQHQSAIAIFAVNLLLGWTLIGWLIALAWSFGGTYRTALRQAELRQPVAVVYDDGDAPIVRRRSGFQAALILLIAAFTIAVVMGWKP